MSDFIIGNASLGSSTGYVASGDCYQRAKLEVQSILASGQTPEVDRATLQAIQNVAGPFSYEERKKLGI